MLPAVRPVSVPDSEFIGPGPDAPSYGDLLSRVAQLEAALRPFTFDPDGHVSQYPSREEIVHARAVLAESNWCYRP